MADISQIVLPNGDTYNLKDATSGYMTGMTILSYGHSTWNDFLTAYQANRVIYCRASSNSNPGTGDQLRLAFMAYISGSDTTPTSVEFQYYRSVSSHSASQQGDQVFIYLLKNTGAWSVTTREASAKIVASTGLTSSYSSDTLTVKAKLKSDTASTLNAESMGSTANRQYAVGVDKSGYLSVNVPWTDTVPSNASDVGAIAAPASANERDFLVYDGSAWVPQSVNYATPQQYGAVGDGVADDADAINDCINENQFVYIPEGLYRVTKSIEPYIISRNTIICSDKAMFIADSTAFNSAISSATSIGERPSVLKLSKYVGWNQYGLTWFGGVINCNNVEGLIGVSINQYAGAFAYVPKMFVTNIGDDGVGVYINSPSSKIRFDQLSISGATITVGQTGNWTLSRNLEHTTIGLYNDNAYDYSIGTLDINSCTVGIYSNSGDDNYCEHYHYWMGADTDSISYTQYLKTRAFQGTGRWTFGHFYNDQAYIGAECTAIICENVKHNTAPVSSITNVPSGTTVVSYLLYPKSSWNSYVMNNIRVYQNTIKFAGVLYTDVTYYSLWRLNALKFSVATGAVKDFGDTYFGIYNGNFMRFAESLTANTKYIIGYVQKPMPGQIHLRFNHTNLVGSCDIIIYDNNIYIENAIQLYGAGTWTIAIGSTAHTIQGETFYPIVLYHDTNRGWTAWDIQADGTAPIMAPPSNESTYSGSVTGSVTFTSGLSTWQGGSY